jgi:ABC-type glycerol-3-phosphate transport system permease component
MTFLIALSVNLAGMLLIYSLLAYALARLSWHDRGIAPVFAGIVVAGQFWIVPTLLVPSLGDAALVFHSLSFCNWLISGFSVIVLCQGVRWIPPQLEDSARLDGCGWFGIYWHVLLPFVARELSLLAFLTALGTSILLLGLLALRDASGFSAGLSLELMAGASLVATLSVIVVFLFAKGSLIRRREPAG